MSAENVELIRGLARGGEGDLVQLYRGDPGHRAAARVAAELLSDALRAVGLEG